MLLASGVGRRWEVLWISRGGHGAGVECLCAQSLTLWPTPRVALVANQSREDRCDGEDADHGSHDG